MRTYQDFLAVQESNLAEFLMSSIGEHTASPLYQIAADANAYDRQENTTICNYVKTIMTASGIPMLDITAANNKITSNFFRRLNTQRNTYSLGNGITFPKEDIKKKLGSKFDTQIKKAGYRALIHGVSFVYWNLDRLHIFPLTEFVPFWDEETGALMAGIRFWRIAPDKPLQAVLYELDGYTKYRAGSDLSKLEKIKDRQSYKQKVKKSIADGEEVIGGDNYSALPIIPLWGSELKQSTLIGMKAGIDSFDLVRSGFANDLSDCAQIYWVLENAGGMSEADLSAFRERLLLRHIATVDADAGSKVEPYTQEIPFEARTKFLDGIRAGIYEDFGGLDVHTVAAGATNDHIDAAYQPLDENADDYEYQLIECIQQILALQDITGEDATPQFKRNRISNQREQVEMIVLEAPYLDDETILSKLPNVTPDEVKSILSKKTAEDANRYKTGVDEDAEPEPGANKGEITEE